MERFIICLAILCTMTHSQAFAKMTKKEKANSSVNILQKIDKLTKKGKVSKALALIEKHVRLLNDRIMTDPDKNIKCRQDKKFPFKSQIISKKKLQHLYRNGEYYEASQVGNVLLDLIKRRYGRNSLTYAVTLWEVADAFVEVECISQSIKLSLQAVEIYKKLNRYWEQAQVLNNIGGAYLRLEKYDTSLLYYLNAMFLVLKNEKSLFDQPYRNIVEISLRKKDFIGALELLKDIETIHRKSYTGPQLKSALCDTYLSRGVIYSNQNNLDLAELEFKKCIRVLDTLKYSQDLTLRAPGIGYNNTLVWLARISKTFEKAEQRYKKALKHANKLFGQDNSNQHLVINSYLALMYERWGKLDKAEKIFRISTRVIKERFGVKSIQSITAEQNLAKFLISQGRLFEAIQILNILINRCFEIIGRTHSSCALILANTSSAYLSLGHYTNSTKDFKRAYNLISRANTILANSQRKIGHHDNVKILLAKINIALGNYDQATENITSVEMNSGSEKVLDAKFKLLMHKGHYNKAIELYKKEDKKRSKLKLKQPLQDFYLKSRLSIAFYKRKDWENAYIYSQSAIHLWEKNILNQVPTSGTKVWDFLKKGTREYLYFFEAMVNTYYNFSTQSGNNKVAANLAFKAAQYLIQPSASEALMKMALRETSDKSKMRELIRRQQDLVNQWNAIEQDFIEQKFIKSQSTNLKNVMQEELDLDKIEREILSIEKKLKVEYPRFFEISTNTALTPKQIQELINENEAFIFFLAKQSKEGSLYQWVITKEKISWVKLNLNYNSLAQNILTLRCGLDRSVWQGITYPAKCSKALNLKKAPNEDDALPFHLGIAHKVYTSLFGQVEGQIRGKNLVIVGSGPLTSLPFQVLVTKKNEIDLPKTFEGYKNIKWLGIRQPISILPSVRSLSALRRDAKRSPALKDYLGYGNPALRGNRSCPPDFSRAVRRLRRSYGANLDTTFEIGSNQQALIAAIRKLCPLPDTSYELKAIAKSFENKNKTELKLGVESTEANIKARNDLNQYRIIHFATHGLLAGDTEKLARHKGEPSLVFTPPEKPKDQYDDGLLMASEVSQLKLNADWVIMSACNTAGGEQPGAEALSGLARAFFYAGARTLLVSHWPVYSDAAVQLTTYAFNRLQKDNVTKAEAMRLAMINMMLSKSHKDNSHPEIWAPFVIVGDGR